MLVEGSYHKLQASNLDFTKLLGSSSEATSKNTSVDSYDPRKVYNRHVSIQSLESYSDEMQFNNVQVEPVEVAETRIIGSVSSSVYSSYYSAGGSTFKIIFFIFICIFTQILASGGDFWLTYWYN